MKQDKDLDKLFRENLEHANINDIPQAYLDDINQKLDNLSTSRKKRGGYWRIVLVIIPILCVLCFATYYLILNTISPSKTGKKNIESKPSKNTIYNQQSLNSETINNSSSLVNTNHSGLSEGKNAGQIEQIAERDVKALDKENNTKSIGSVTSKAIQYSKSYADDSKRKSPNENLMADNSSVKANNRTEKTDYNKQRNLTVRKTKTTSYRSGNTNVSKNVSTSKNESADENISTDNSHTNNTVNNAHLTKDNLTSNKTSSNNNGIANTTRDASKSKKEKLNNNSSDFSERESSKKSSIVAEENNKNTIEKINETNKFITPVNKSETQAPLTNVNTDNTKNAATLLSKKDSVMSSTITNAGTNENNVKKDSAINTQPLKNIVKTADSLSLAKADTIQKIKKDTLASAKIDSTQKANPTNDASSRALSLNILAGGLNVYSAFTGKNEDYDTKRKNEEHSFTAFDATVLLNYALSKLILSAGLNYSQWGEKINYSTTIDSVAYLTGYDTTYTTEKINDNTFMVTPKVGTLYANKGVENTTLASHNGINKYSYATIPVLVGYKFSIYSFNVIPKLGATVGIPINTKGYYVSNDLKSIVQEKTASWIINYQASLDIKYSFFVVSPFYRRSSSSVINSGSTNNKYSGLGIQAGFCIPIK